MNGSAAVKDQKDPTTPVTTVNVPRRLEITPWLAGYVGMAGVRLTLGKQIMCARVILTHR